MGLMSFVGCGDSQQDLIMRAANRPRPTEDENEKFAAVESPSPSSSVVSNPGSTNNSTDSSNDTKPVTPALETDASAASQTSKVAADLPPTIPTIESRRPSEPLSDFEKRKRAAENIKKIGAALAAFIEKNQRFPGRGLKTRSGIVTLSWRVELLPYLGYPELYQKFDANQPWDSPKNLALLEYIPECYVSPERFDTSTNYLGVTGRLYIFQDSSLRLKSIEDGTDNTLAVLEVNDELAVPWTSPSDYEPEYGAATSGIGNLRPEGTYALWANGWPTLVRKEITSDQLHKAFTYESVDGLSASEIHTALMIKDTSGNARVASDQTATVGQNLTSSEAENSGEPRTTVARDASGNVGRSVSEPRIALPTRIERTNALDRVNELFAEQLKYEGNRQVMRQLSQEMLASADGMRSDPAGAYALQVTAIKTAAKAGDLDILKTAVDQHVAMFETDAIEANSVALKEFGEENGGALADAVDGRQYIKQALPVIYGLILEDSYDITRDLGQFAVMYESRSGNREFLPDLNRLKSQLLATKNFYARTGDALAELRADPKNAAANSTVGRYVTFIKGDWENGLPLLAMGDNDRLAQMAKADIATHGSSSEQMMTTADAWWDLADSTSNELFKNACRERAAYWYELASQTMPESLAKLHANSRLKEFDRSTGGSPLASLQKLAKGLGMDLTDALESLKNPARARTLVEDDTDG